LDLDAYIHELDRMNYYDNLNYFGTILSNLKTLAHEVSLSPHASPEQKFQILVILNDLTWIRADYFKLKLEVQYSQPTSHSQNSSQNSNEHEQLQKIIEKLYEKRTYPEFDARVSRLCSHFLALMPTEPKFKQIRERLLEIQKAYTNDQALNPQPFLEDIGNALQQITRQKNNTHELQDLINEVTTLRVQLLDKNMEYLKSDMRRDCWSVRDSSNLQIERNRNDIFSLTKRMTACTDEMQKINNTIDNVFHHSIEVKRDVQHLQNKAKSKSKWHYGLLGADASALPALLEQLEQI
jgi:hypothetical protein